MDDTHQFVEKLHETQKKDKQNKRRQGRGDSGENAGQKLPGKQHSTNK
ncbi:DUF4023 family protein [Cohnella lupini]|jgi:hypothetical protein|uniref:Uncharacterized protein DUF4023 n=1 Tax=Cohnella lupini TaxID=1294267 RepID=A0A3D9I8L1_9BACL|nr:DUF4023 family protein [Cohnella lupini]RED58030.1 uncharacterized protein DUF4023 [Cohnella lupini]